MNETERYETAKQLNRVMNRIIHDMDPIFLVVSREHLLRVIPACDHARIEEAVRLLSASRMLGEVCVDGEVFYFRIAWYEEEESVDHGDVERRVTMAKLVAGESR